jgi:CheY-like chemotaxis protein
MSLKIMIVDDEPANLQLMRSLAAPLAHTVFAFADVQQAAQRAEQQRFDVVFLGQRPPQLDALALTRQIRNSQPNYQAAIVMLSTTDDVTLMRSAFSEGADFVLPRQLTVARLRPILAAMDSPNWKGKRHTARLPLFTDVTCISGERIFPLRSLNISESGMLLQPAVDVPLDAEVSLDFKVPDAVAPLNLRARIVRKEAAERVAVEFLNLTPENRNAIQLYVLGRLKGPDAPREKSYSREPMGPR